MRTSAKAHRAATGGTPPGLAALLEEQFPDWRLTAIEPLVPRRSSKEERVRRRREFAADKATGYGEPLRIDLVGPDGARRTLVLHTAKPNDFGHDRRSDRAQLVLLGYDTFDRIPKHVRPLDVGAIQADGRLLSLRESGEFYLLTSFAPGTLYADDLKRVAVAGAVQALDVARCEALARYLVDLHRQRGRRPAAYRRAIRDLVGHGEGIFGIVDGYPEDVPAAPAERLRAIEERACRWRWRLRNREHRLRRTHGDFHPFNVVFEKSVRFTLLDASRGCEGDPADDVAAMIINYLFFGLERPSAWSHGMGTLWRRFLDAYLTGGDTELCEVIPPFFAWRGLVLCNPCWYPTLSAQARDRLMTFIEAVLEKGRLDPEDAARLYP